MASLTQLIALAGTLGITMYHDAGPEPAPQQTSRPIARSLTSVPGQASEQPTFPDGTNLAATRAITGSRFVPALASPDGVSRVEVIGGLLAATSLTVLVVPVIHDLIDSRRERRAGRRAVRQSRGGRETPVPSPTV